MEMRKGFIFTMDAMFAMVIATAVIIGAYSLIGHRSNDVVVMDRIASDILFVLDENESLRLQNSSVKSIIDGLMPSNMKYMYNFTFFNVTGSSLAQDGVYYFNGVSAESDLVISIRAVPVFERETGSSARNMTRIVRARLGVSV